jgi:hypothetical protein
MVKTVKIESLVIGTEKPEQFIDALDKLCQHFSSDPETSGGNGYTFKFNVEE